MSYSTQLMSIIPKKYHQDIKHELKTLPITIIFIVLSLYYSSKIVFGIFVCYKIAELYIRYQSWLIELLTPQNKSITKEEFEARKVLFYITVAIILIPTVLSDSDSIRDYITENTNNNKHTNNTKKSTDNIDKSLLDKIFDYIYDLCVEIQHTYRTVKTLPEQNSVSDTTHSHNNTEENHTTTRNTNTEAETEIETNT